MSTVIAKIDLDQVGQYDETNPGVDFFNEIDIWAQMEFQSRHQITRLKNKKSLSSNRTLQGLSPRYYSFRDE
jgi:hypothetical protein